MHIAIIARAIAFEIVMILIECVGAVAVAPFFVANLTTAMAFGVFAAVAPAAIEFVGAAAQVPTSVAHHPSPFISCSMAAWSWWLIDPAQNLLW